MHSPEALFAVDRGGQPVLIRGEAMEHFQTIGKTKEGKLHATGFLQQELEQLLFRMLLVLKGGIDEVEHYRNERLAPSRCRIVAEDIRRRLGSGYRSGGPRQGIELMEVLDLLGSSVFLDLKVR